MDSDKSGLKNRVMDMAADASELAATTPYYVPITRYPSLRLGGCSKQWHSSAPRNIMICIILILGNGTNICIKYHFKLSYVIF